MLSHLVISLLLIEMFSKYLPRFYFALIKAAKPKKEIDLTIEGINRCRSLLGLQPCQSQDMRQKIGKYIKDRTSSVADGKQSLNEIYRVWSMLKPIQCQLAILSQSTQMGPAQQKYLKRVIQYWGKLLLGQQSNQRNTTNSNSKDIFKTIIRQYSNAINSTCYLINLDESMIILYLKIHMLWQKIGADDKNFSHLRYIIQNLLALKTIRQDSLQFLLFFTSRFPMQSIYHQKEKAVFEFIYKNLPIVTQHKRQTAHPKVIANLLFNISVLTQIPKQIKNLVIQLYKTHNSLYVKQRAFNTLLELFVIDKTNIQNQQNISNLRRFVSQLPFQSFKYLSKSLYRLDIWIPDFWVPYFEYVSTDNNFKQIQEFNHFVIDDLIAENKGIDKSVKKAAQRFRQNLKVKGIDIQKYDLRKGYQKSFGRLKENSNSCQLHVANSMRLICGAQILTQVPIKYFLVDVIVDNQVIVQINNTSHYKTIDGETRLNLKSQFRERILEQNGYKCYNIKVDDLSSSNYNMLQEIYRIVEQSTKMKKRPKQAVL